MAELQGLRVARAIAAELRGGEAPAPFDGTGFCPVEIGEDSGALVQGDWYADPEPVVAIEGPSARLRGRQARLRDGAPAALVRRLTTSERSAGARDEMDVPFARHALELVRPALGELDPRADDEILHRARRRAPRSASASAAIRAPMWTASPSTPSPRARSRRCAGRRGSRCRAPRTASRIAQAHRIARAGPSNVARNPSPVDPDLVAAEPLQLLADDAVMLARGAPSSCGRRARPRARSSRRCR